MGRRVLPWPAGAAMMRHGDGGIIVGGRLGQCDLHADESGVRSGGRDGSFVGQGQQGDREWRR